MASYMEHYSKYSPGSGLTPALAATLDTEPHTDAMAALQREPLPSAHTVTNFGGNTNGIPWVPGTTTTPYVPPMPVVPPIQLYTTKASNTFVAKAGETVTVTALTDWLFVKRVVKDGAETISLQGIDGTADLTPELVAAIVRAIS